MIIHRYNLLLFIHWWNTSEQLENLITTKDLRIDFYLFPRGFSEYSGYNDQNNEGIIFLFLFHLFFFFLLCINCEKFLNLKGINCCKSWIDDENQFII